jgi:hypothetical protein
MALSMDTLFMKRQVVAHLFFLSSKLIKPTTFPVMEILIFLKNVEENEMRFSFLGLSGFSSLHVEGSVCHGFFKNWFR